MKKTLPTLFTAMSVSLAAVMIAATAHAQQNINIRGDATIAIDVRPIPPTAPQGLSPFDLQPGSTMTNAAVEAAVEAVGGQELVLNYKTGSVKVLVPPGTPMSQSTPGNRSDIKPGETVFVSARPAEGGAFTAVRVQVSRDGVKPTQ
jgi:hypothetical protein